MDLGIAGRKAIVCASSKGLGKACAAALAREGALVTINSRDAANLEATAAETLPDGMKVDSQGNVWSCGPGGLHVFSPDAVLLGVIRFEAFVANLCFGDDDRRSLFVTVTDKVVRLRVRVAGPA